MEGFRHLDHPTDIASEIKGTTIEGLFSLAAEVWKCTALEFSSSESPFELHIEIEAASLEDLLIEFLNELNYILNTRKLVFSKIKNISITQDTVSRVSAAIYFADFNPAMHKLKTVIKAITFLKTNIEQKDNSFITNLVFNV